MRNMSFFLTQQQILDRSKTVTRRKGWNFLKPGELIQAVDKMLGLKKGEHPKKLAVIRVVSTRWEPLNAITEAEVVREGFPDMTREQFIVFFCEKMGCWADTVVNRIEFEYVEKVIP